MALIVHNTFVEEVRRKASVIEEFEKRKSAPAVVYGLPPQPPPKPAVLTLPISCKQVGTTAAAGAHVPCAARKRSESSGGSSEESWSPSDDDTEEVQHRPSGTQVAWPRQEFQGQQPQWPQYLQERRESWRTLQTPESHGHTPGGPVHFGMPFVQAGGAAVPAPALGQRRISSAQQPQEPYTYRAEANATFPAPVPGQRRISTAQRPPEPYTYRAEAPPTPQASAQVVQPGAPCRHFQPPHPAFGVFPPHTPNAHVMTAPMAVPAGQATQLVPCAGQAAAGTAHLKLIHLNSWADANGNHGFAAADPAVPLTRGTFDTTIMLRNVPQRYKRDQLLADILARGFGGAFDFFYMPVDFSTAHTVGYAFINFTNPDELERFRATYNGLRLSGDSSKVCAVNDAKVQGKARNVEYYRNSSVMGMEEQYHPVVFEEGHRVPFPQPTRAIKVVQVKR